jgi:hypothetical protein
VCPLALVAGCALFEDPTPNEARVVIDGSTGATVRVVTSTEFVAGVNELRVTRVVILASDTVVATLPFQRSYDIGTNHQFFIEASRMNADVATFRMQVYVDEDKEFDQGGTLIVGAPFRFVYQFNKFLTDAIEVVF